MLQYFLWYQSEANTLDVRKFISLQSKHVYINQLFADFFHENQFGTHVWHCDSLYLYIFEY